MILGVGIDIVEIPRIDNEIRRYGNRFTERVFSQREIDYCEGKANRAQHYAARFAAKEALFKALGTGWQKGVSWCEASLDNDVSGRPMLHLEGRVRELSEKIGVKNVHVSISHSQSNAIAVVMLET